MNMQERRHQLGCNIREARKARGISQRSFAQMVGISQPYLSAVESGEKNIGYNNLCKIADGLDLSVSQLVDDASPRGRELHPAQPNQDHPQSGWSALRV